MTLKLKRLFRKLSHFLCSEDYFIFWLIVSLVLVGWGQLYLQHLSRTTPKVIFEKTPEQQLASESLAIRAVVSEGYTNPIETGFEKLACGAGDSILTSRNVEATNINGKRVKLNVCCGLVLKGCTIRHTGVFQ